MPYDRNDREIVLTAVNNDGRSLEYALDLENDTEIVLAAVCQILQDDDEGVCNVQLIQNQIRKHSSMKHLGLGFNGNKIVYE